VKTEIQISKYIIFEISIFDNMCTETISMFIHERNVVLDTELVGKIQSVEKLW